MIDGLDKLAIAQYGTTCQIQIAANLHDHVDLIGITHSLEEDRLVGVVVGIGCIDIGNDGNLAVNTLYVSPATQYLLGLT